MAINGGNSGNVTGDTSSNVAATMPVVDQHHPPFLQPSDTPGSSLISVKLTGPENYILWSSTMRISLLGKSKLGFVDGRHSKESFSPSLHDLWEKCNAIVLSWIRNSVSAELLSGMVYASSAHKDRSSRMFDKVNGSRVLFLHKQIATLSLGISSVFAYFSKLKELWAEFDALMPCPGCNCVESRRYTGHFEYQRLLQFLMGLNESYAQSGNQILNMTPVPSINKAYSMIISEESRRSMTQSHTSELTENTALFSNGKGKGVYISDGASSSGHNTSGGGGGIRLGSSQISKSNYVGGYGGSTNGDSHNPGQHSGSASYGSNYRSKKSHLYCDYCHFKGHTRETCYKLIGYPNDSKQKKKFGSSNMSGNTAHYSQDNSNAIGGGQITGTSQSYLGSANSHGTPPGIPQFTQEQYNQLLQLLEQGANNSDSAMTAGIASCSIASQASENEYRWIVDSGGSSHMVNTLNLLTDFKRSVDIKGGKVHLPTGSVAYVTHIGSAHIFQGQKINNVMHLPEFKYNLLSVSKLTKELRWAVLFYPDFCIFQDLLSGQAKGIVKEDDDLYIINSKTTCELQKVTEAVRKASQCSSTTMCTVDVLKNKNKTVDAMIWHRRLGHVPLSTLQKIRSLQPVLCDNKVQDCTVCPLAKQTRLPFPLSTSVANACLHTIHGDVWGPYRVPTYDDVAHHHQEISVRISKRQPRARGMMMMKITGNFQMEVSPIETNFQIFFLCGSW